MPGMCPAMALLKENHASWQVRAGYIWHDFKLFINIRRKSPLNLNIVIMKELESRIYFFLKYVLLYKFNFYLIRR